MAHLLAPLPKRWGSIFVRLSSHHWSRELQALGHTVRLMPPAYVKPAVVLDLVKPVRAVRDNGRFGGEAELKRLKHGPKIGGSGQIANFIATTTSKCRRIFLLVYHIASRLPRQQRQSGVRSCGSLT